MTAGRGRYCPVMLMGVCLVVIDRLFWFTSRLSANLYETKGVIFLSRGINGIFLYFMGTRTPRAGKSGA